MQPTILYIETATPVCSVSIARGEEVLALENAAEPNAHARMLAVLIQRVLDKTGLKANQLDAVCVSEGPGSYTGLRIGFATAKGICYAVNIPLIVVNTLQSLANRIRKSGEMGEGAIILPALDARRNDVYWNLYDQNLRELSQTKCNNVNDISVVLPEDKIIVSGGTGAFKFDTAVTEKKMNNIKTISIDASSIGLIEPGLAAFQKDEFADLAYCEPLYLKEFGEK